MGPLSMAEGGHADETAGRAFRNPLSHLLMSRMELTDSCFLLLFETHGAFLFSICTFRVRLKATYEP